MAIAEVNEGRFGPCVTMWARLAVAVAIATAAAVYTQVIGRPPKRHMAPTNGWQHVRDDGWDHATAFSTTDPSACNIRTVKATELEPTELRHLQEPLLIVNASAHWGALQAWNLSYVRAMLSGIELSMKRSSVFATREDSRFCNEHWSTHRALAWEHNHVAKRNAGKNEMVLRTFDTMCAQAQAGIKSTTIDSYLNTQPALGCISKDAG